MSGHRAQRVADIVRRELARLVQEELRDPRVGFVTITDVKVSSDLRHAQVYCTVLDRVDHGPAIEALRRATPFLRRSLAGRTELRFTPELNFHYDEVVESGMRLEKILRDVLPEESEAPDPDPESEDG